MSKKTRKIAVGILKGGVGKTTTTASLGYGLAAFKGARVLLVDCDAQNQLGFFLNAPRDTGLGEYLADWYGKKDPSYRKFVVSARNDASIVLDIMPAGYDLALATTIISSIKYRPDRFLSEALQPAESDYDYIILDVGPGLNELLINCLVFAEEVICPMTMEPASVLSLIELQNRMDPVQKDRPDLKLTTIVPTFYSTQSKEYPGILKELQEEYQELLTAPVRRTVSFTKASREGKTIFEFLPNSKSANDYMELINRVYANGGKDD